MADLSSWFVSARDFFAGVDKTALLEWSKLGVSVGTLIVGSIGVSIAWQGLEKWRTEAIGKREIELAEEAIKLFNEAASHYEKTGRSIRLFVDFNMDSRFFDQEKLRESILSDARKLRIDVDENDFKARLETLSVIFRAYFGNTPTALIAFIMMTNARIQLWVCADQVLASVEAQETQQQAAERLERAGLSSQKSDLDRNLETAISKIEEMCLPILQRASKRGRSRSFREKVSSWVRHIASRGLSLVRGPAKTPDEDTA